MAKVREKLLDWKRRLSDRHMYSIFVVVVAVVALWGIYQYKRAADLRQELDNQYNRAFYEMVGYVQNIEVLLMKSMISATPQMVSETLKEAWHQANLAQTNLGQLPVTQEVLANTSKFLSQVGDFAYALDRQNLSGKGITEEQYKQLEQLYQYSVSLNEALNNLQASISGGRIQWNELANKGTELFKKQSQSMTAQLFSDVDKTFQEFPTLIYDGPFSDHMTSLKPKGVTGNEVSVEEAKEKLKKFFGEDKVASIEHVGDINADTLPAYNFKITFKDRPEDEFATADVTKTGGHVIWMLYSRNVGQETLDVDKVKQIGKEFLESRGYKNMKDTYYIKEDGTATVNYAYEQNGVVVYPDLIKVKIALDNGEIVGFEAKGYLMNHTERDIPEPKVSEAEIRANFMAKKELKSVGLAIIPTNFGTEIFCYELKGRMNDRDFLVYINAETGREEKVLIIIDTPEGILTL
ncbi:sporulation protein YpeB [Thermoclostridium stercorarium subsp. stercorarium DSM 8532]|uniref:Sporulation protein YpeB n=3 Tax=Thermoclostridium stercorarium TaxID=1510 RepID=L7VSR9_THES1|nr:germination protein YpeB [Thermoclostridium stercorarium]AGC69426.1 sporulation protein YpeB [Thermoclostridium stercorarium subsp. stercorarium DSM 8532]